MSLPGPLPGGKQGAGYRPPARLLRVLAVVFSVATGLSLVSVGLDLFIGRPAAGDLFIAALNTVAAVMLWRWDKASRRADAA